MTTPSLEEEEGETDDESELGLLFRSSYLPLRHPLRSYFSLIWIEGQKIDCITMKNFCNFKIKGKIGPVFHSN